MGQLAIESQTMGGGQWRWGRGWDQPSTPPLPHPLFSAAAGPGWGGGQSGCSAAPGGERAGAEPNPGLLLPRPAPAPLLHPPGVPERHRR